MRVRRGGQGGVWEVYERRAGESGWSGIEDGAAGESRWRDVGVKEGVKKGAPIIKIDTLGVRFRVFFPFHYICIIW